MIYGYARVSTKEQNEARQIKALTDFGVDQRKIFLDKQSGKDFNRDNYQKLIRKLKEDDVVVFQSIDRMGRQYEEIIEQWKLITKDKKASIVILDMPLLNTAEDKDLTRKLIADIVLQLMSYVAETERAFIKKRQKEGIELAKQRGIHFGRSPIEIPEQFPALKEQYLENKISARSAARLLNISHQTFIKWVKQEDGQ